jgi:hypothetical protein
MNTDLRQEIWHCLRYWLFDYHYFGPSPFPPHADYNIQLSAFHALSHWKCWMARKPAFAGVRLEARYHKKVRNDRGGTRERVQLHFPPDGGEVKYHDYLLRKLGGSQPEVLCAAEVEYGIEVRHVTEDLRKLVAVRSPLKVMFYRMDYANRLPPEVGFAERKQAIEAMISADPAYASDQQREDWLFVGYPYHDKPYPKHGEETDVRLYTLATPCKSISLVEPDWGTSGSPITTWISGFVPCIHQPADRHVAPSRAT